MVYYSLKSNKSGRNHKLDFNHYLDTIIYVLRTGISWSSLKVPLHYSTYYKFFIKLINKNVFNITHTLLCNLYKSTYSKTFKELFIDSSMIKNINGSEFLGRNHYDRFRKGNKITVLVDKIGFPVSVHISTSNIHDSTLIKDTINCSKVKIIKTKIIGDKGYINKSFNDNPEHNKLICPVRKNQKRANTNKELLLLDKRHIVENFFSWLKKFRRVQQRYDKKIKVFTNFVYLATCMIISNKLFVD